MSTWENIAQRATRCSQDGFLLTEAEIDGLDDDIDQLVSEVRKFANLAAAETCLATLGALQACLALLLFKYRAPLTWKQRALVREFDRSDDPELRAVMFRNIKDDRFP